MKHIYFFTYLLKQTRVSLVLLLFILPVMKGVGQYVVNFEGTGETKTAYASGNVTLSGISWNMTEALIGTDAADYKYGIRSARLRGYSSSGMTMLANKSNGIGTISFSYWRYGTDPQVTWKVEYSTNDGSSWTQAGSNFSAPANNNEQTFSVIVNVSGDIRIRIVHASDGASTNRRMNIDNITITDYVTAAPTITVTPTSLTGFTYAFGSGPSSEQSFIISGSNLTANISITPPTNYEISTGTGGSFLPTNPVTSTQSGGTVSNTTIYVRLKAGLSAGNYNNETITASSTSATNKTVTCSGTVYKPEPTNHVTDFNCSNETSSSLKLDWTDASSGTVPDGYLILWSNVGFGDITAPVDGTTQTDGTGVKNIIQGSQSYTVTGLSASTTYYFKIYPYTNSGSNINYKIDGTVPQTNCTTLAGVCATENFTNLPTASSSSYLARSWTGTDNVTWTAEGARTDQTLTGKAICFGNSGNRWVTSPTYSGGMGTLSFKYVRAFTGTSARSLEVYVNNEKIGGTITVSPTSDDVVTYSEVINVTGDVVLEIRSTGAAQVKIDDISWTCYTAPCYTPTNHASTVTSATVTTNSSTINWVNGNGVERIVVMRAANDVNANPANNTTYTANTAFGSGSEIGTGNFVVNKGSGNSVNVTNLAPGTVYYVKIFEFACAAGSEEYYTSGTPGNTSFFTTPNSPTNFTSVCLNTTSVDLTWGAPQAGEFDGYMLVGRTAAGELSVASIDPAAQSHNLNFASAPTYGASPEGRILYIGTGTSATVTGLTNATAYTFRVYTYKKIGTVNKFSSSTSITRTTGLNDVSNAAVTGVNSGAFVSWVNPNSTCFDEVLVVANTTSGIIFSPSGDGSAYTPNPAYAGINSIVYKGNSFNSVDVTNLVNGTTYYFEIFVRKGTSWSTGVEVSAIPSDVTIFEQGDIAIIAVNTQYLSSGSDDEVCFIGFKDIKPGTSIEFTDNGYERISANFWGNTEGTIRITYNGVSDIQAGTPICIQGSGNSSSDFDIIVCGTNDSVNWTITSLNGSLYSFDLNSNDQIWIFQNGAWNPGTQNAHNATYSGNVVWGWTAVGWEPSPGYASTVGSTLVDGTECFNIDLNGKTNPSKIKYTGPLTTASQSQWITRINDTINWTGYLTNVDYNAVSGKNYSGECVPFQINTDGFQAGKWTGARNNDWFVCSNWENLRVPDKYVDVTIPNTTNKPVIGAGTAESKDITIQASSNLTMNDASSNLEVSGDILISGTLTASAGLMKIIDDNSSLSAASPVSLYNLELLKNTSSQTLTINNNVQVSNTLIMNSGNIVTGSNRIELGTSTSNKGSLTYNNGYIIGNMRRWFNGTNSGLSTGLFPIGFGSGTPMNRHFYIQFTTAPSTGGYLDVYYVPSSMTYNGLPINGIPSPGGLCTSSFDVTSASDDGYWVADEQTGTLSNGNYTLTLYGEGLNATTYCQMTLLKRLGTGPWTAPGNHLEPTIFPSVSRSGLSGFSNFGFGGGEQNILPVELISFDATLQHNDVLLEWITASETNNERFEIERMHNTEKHFRTVGIIPGSGNSNVEMYYSAIDKNVPQGILYYRLRQIDYDGKSEYVGMKTVANLSGQQSLTIVNPFADHDALSFGLMNISGSYVIVDLLDITGKQIYSQRMEVDEASYQVNISASLSAGFYVLTVRDAASTATVKLLR